MVTTALVTGLWCVCCRVVVVALVVAVAVAVLVAAGKSSVLCGFSCTWHIMVPETVVSCHEVLARQ